MVNIILPLQRTGFLLVVWNNNKFILGNASVMWSISIMENEL
jgi:hypothetical protein